MKALKFNLSGNTAFFKKPDVNTYLYFTYGNIHKIAILGLIGAAIGLEGYNAQGKREFPQFYSELNSLNISIVPRNEKGYISKKIQVFNNCVGYASKEDGGNLIIREQWLEKPVWDIYILIDDNKNMKLIKNSFFNNCFTYIPYLGKNDHYANITNVQLVDINKTNKVQNINSLFIKEYFEFKNEKKDTYSLDSYNEDIWKYEERLPVTLERQENQYETASFIFTNMKLKLKKNCNIFSEAERTLFFF